MTGELREIQSLILSSASTMGCRRVFEGGFFSIEEDSFESWGLLELAMLLAVLTRPTSQGRSEITGIGVNFPKWHEKGEGDIYNFEALGVKLGH
jgi:hypothetical protein